MMNAETFLFCLSAISIVTSLVVEAIKKIYSCDCYNLIAGAVAVILTVLTAVGYAMWTGAVVDEKYIIFFICMVLASWISSMLGFDKVKQSSNQLGDL